MHSTTIILLCLAVTLGWASPIGNVMERDPEMNPDLFEGDIMGVLPGELPRNAVRDPSLLWPGGVVYYTINKSVYTEQELATLKEAFDKYQNFTCITFVERTNQVNYVSIQKTGGGCYSYVGMIGGAQTLSLDASCFRCSATGCMSGTPIHEFLHALGFHHEQSRSDRDDYVIINWDNIQPGKENNFKSYTQDEIQHLDAPYDYGSVLHYSAYGFAIDPTIPTIIVPDGVSIGQRVGFSEVDIYEVNTLYGCSKKQE